EQRLVGAINAGDPWNSSWFQSKRSVLKGSVTLVDIRERTEYVRAAAADFDCGDTMGRIIGWVSGDFDFEVVDREGQDVSGTMSTRPPWMNLNQRTWSS